MPPSPVVVEVPAIRAPRDSAALAFRDRAPKLIPVTISGMSSSIGCEANRVPSTVLRRALLAVAFQRDAGERAGDERQVVERRPGPRPEDAEPADPVAGQLGLDLDVLDHAGRERARRSIGEGSAAVEVRVGGGSVSRGSGHRTMDLAVSRLRGPIFQRCRSACWKFQSFRPATSLRKRGGAATFQRSSRPKTSVAVVGGELVVDGVGAELAGLAADEDGAGVHAVGHAVGGVAADDQDPLLHHEAGHRPDVAADDQGAPLHRDPGAGRGVAADDDRPGADRRGDGVAGVAVDRRPCRRACSRPRPSRRRRGPRPSRRRSGRPRSSPRCPRSSGATPSGSATPRLCRAAGLSRRIASRPAAIAARIAWLIARTGRSPQSIVVGPVDGHGSVLEVASDGRSIVHGESGRAAGDGAAGRTSAGPGGGSATR